MAHSVRFLAAALIGAVLINVIYAAPVSEENEIDGPLVDPAVKSITTSTDGLLSSNTEVSPVGGTEERAVTEGSSIEKFEGTKASEASPTGSSESLPGHISDDTPSSTTEDLNKVLGNIYAPFSDKPGRIHFSGGVHRFRINEGEDERERLLQEYHYHFVRVEQNLPHTTLRQNRFRPPSKD